MIGYLGKPKTWVFIVLVSVFIYNLYYLIHGLQFTIGTYIDLGGPAPNAYRTVSSIGHTLRFIGLFLALQAVYLVWGPKTKPFSSVKNKISIALFLEGAYYLSFLPSLFNIMRFRDVSGMTLFASTLFASIYFFQIVLITPFLIIIGLKLKLSNQENLKKSLPKWVGVACAGYMAAIWFNIVFRWFFMGVEENIQFLLTGIIGIGFLPSISTISLSVAFAVIGALLLFKKKINSASKKWFGLSALMMGIHFVFYILYYAYVNQLDFALLVEIWAVSFLGLGLSILINKD